MEDSDDYFRSYEEMDVHYLMLNDHPRMIAYKNAIKNNAELFKNKIVMDVGAGTGILSVFCAQAGASKVFAVEASNLSKLIEKIVDENNFTDIIKVIHSKLEDIDCNTVEKVDIIVSEWMGFYLVHEGMLDTVLLARNKFLKPDGLLFPCIAKLHAVPCQIPEYFDFFNDIYDVKMKSFGDNIRREKSSKPEIMTIKTDNILAEEKILAWIDLNTATIEDCNLIGGQDLVFPCTKDGNFSGTCIWFDVEFPDGSILSTSPYETPTHWKQTIIILPNQQEVVKDEPIAFRISLKRDKTNKRRYNLEFNILNPETTEHDLPCDCFMTKCIVAKQYIENHCQ
ncbi:hypothetical protein PV325_011788 [Microctonus aethiopoides]|uniref:type I protein arginine methyltransferase n=1 Tax=Microctonus aethiopoides TaxID=144406 RepID=A0AA39F1H4_9HYME|nr:hypothetical protein PV325_011788 [Microctonus aethiopoides]KAK0160078.1 hypothetical protein PV328_007523 [Microctonus aethiopoides]